MKTGKKSKKNDGWKKERRREITLNGDLRVDGGEKGRELVKSRGGKETEREREREKKTQTDRQTDRRADKQTNRQENRKKITVRQRDSMRREMDGWLPGWLGEDMEGEEGEYQGRG